MTLPDPLTPPDCDLTGLDYMPLFCARLTDSDLAALSTGDEFKAAVLLWCKAWTQPGASLPKDERILAHYCGVSRDKWADIREVALRGWIECSDGRLYHETVSEAARMAWKARVDYETRTGTFSKKQSQRALSGWAKRRAQAAEYAAASGKSAAASPGQSRLGNAYEREEKGREELEASPLVRNADASSDGEGLPFSQRKAAPSPSKPKPASKRATGCESFDAAWKAWPRKDRSSKSEAFKRWVTHKSGASHKLAAVSAFLASKDAKKDSGAVVPGLERWIAKRLDSWLEISAPTALPNATPDKMPDGPDWFVQLAKQIAKLEPAAWRSYGHACRGEEIDGEFHVFVTGQTALERMGRIVERIESGMFDVPVFVFEEGRAPVR